MLAVYDGTSELELAMSASVDLVLLDIMMPGMNGYNVCRRLRETGNNTPVIVLIARGEGSTRFWDWSWVPITTSPNPSAFVNCLRGFEPSCAEHQSGI